MNFPPGAVLMINLKKPVCPHCTKVTHFEYDASYAGYTTNPVYLVRRVNKATKDWFYGCPNFPKCRYSRNRPLTREEQDIKTWAFANALEGPHY